MRNGRAAAARVSRSAMTVSNKIKVAKANSLRRFVVMAAL
jgi:hypothetical protein